jgi:hypothetical protein
MNNKIPYFLANKRLAVGNFLDGENSLIIGDTEKVLDIKNQYLIEISNNFNNQELYEHKDLAIASIIVDTGDRYTPFHCYPLVEIKKSGSGINDILKKNNDMPSAFVCVHEYTQINRRDFDISENYKTYTNKDNFIKSIEISNNSISFLPKSNNLDLDYLFSFPNKFVQKSFEDFSKEEIKNIQKKLNLIKKQKNKKNGKGEIIKYTVQNGIYNVYNPSIKVEDTEYKGKKYPNYDSFILVVKKYE